MSFLQSHLQSHLQSYLQSYLQFTKSKQYTKVFQYTFKQNVNIFSCLWAEELYPAKEPTQLDC